MSVCFIAVSLKTTKEAENLCFDILIIVSRSARWVNITPKTSSTAGKNPETFLDKCLGFGLVVSVPHLLFKSGFTLTSLLEMRPRSSAAGCHYVALVWLVLHSVASFLYILQLLWFYKEINSPSGFFVLFSGKSAAYIKTERLSC